jgi:hypothetical protein
MTDTDKQIKTCQDCGTEYGPVDTPVWREVRLFGVTWIFGRWKDQWHECPSCQARKEDMTMHRICDEAYDNGYERGYKAARREL